MRKISVLAIAITLLGLASCKKAYKCECTTVDGLSSQVSTRDISKTTKKTAEAICGSSVDTYTDTYYSGSSTTPITNTDTYQTTCVLK